MVLAVAGALAERCRLFAEQDGVECFWHDENASENNYGPDDEDIKRPAPK